MASQPSFERMPGFHKLESLWMIEYKAVSREPVITAPAEEEAKIEVEKLLDKKLAKTYPDLVPLIFEGYAAFSGNAVKGLFRHLISSQLTNAGMRVCVQKVKLGDKDRVVEGRIPQCRPEDPCFVCTWFGTPSRQGALHFSFLKSVKPFRDVLAENPIPMVALSDEFMGVSERAFLLVVPLKPGTEFRGWIKGENLSREIIGAIKEVVDMSKAGFVQFGALKTRGFGAMELEILSIEKYSTRPFQLEKKYTGNELEDFLNRCQGEYHKLLKSTGAQK
ncbi:MAG: RAMP superfamily CRISPR-associated protein [Desulfurococcaceae archaeon]